MDEKEFKRKFKRYLAEMTAKLNGNPITSGTQKVIESEIKTWIRQNNYKVRCHTILKNRNLSVIFPDIRFRVNTAI